MALGPLGPWAHGPLGPWAHAPWAHGPWAHGPWDRQENDENASVTSRHGWKCIRYRSPCPPMGSYSVEVKRTASRMPLEAFPALQDLKNGPKTQKLTKNLKNRFLLFFCPYFSFKGRSRVRMLACW